MSTLTLQFVLDFHEGDLRIGTSENKMMQQKCREEGEEKGDGEFVLSINIKLSISQLQAHERRLLGDYLVIQTLQTHLRTHRDKVKKKKIFLLQFHET